MRSRGGDFEWTCGACPLHPDGQSTFQMASVRVGTVYVSLVCLSPSLILPPLQCLWRTHRTLIAVGGTGEQDTLRGDLQYHWAKPHPAQTPSRGSASLGLWVLSLLLTQGPALADVPSPFVRFPSCDHGHQLPSGLCSLLPEKPLAWSHSLSIAVPFSSPLQHGLCLQSLLLHCS